MAQAAEASDAPFQLVGATGIGKGLFDELAGFGGWLGSVGWALLHLFPEAHGIAQLAEGEQAKPLMVLGKDEGFATGAERVAIAFLDGVRRFLSREAEMLG